MLDPSSDRAIYLQLADELRARIRRGGYQAGSPLPSESELMDEFSVSRTTARQAYTVLRTEGLVTSLRGRGVFVRTQPAIRRIASTRYADQVQKEKPPPAGTTFTQDSQIRSEDHRLDREFREVQASDEIAQLLGVPPGSLVLERRFVLLSMGVPQQMSTSYLPLDLVRSTTMANPRNEPGPGGTVAQLGTLGKRVTRVEEAVRARMPTPDEVRTLRLDAGVPVIAITRRMLAGDEPVEVAAEIVMPADRVVLDYRIDLPAEGA